MATAMLPSPALPGKRMHRPQLLPLRQAKPNRNKSRQKRQRKIPIGIFIIPPTRKLLRITCSRLQSPRPFRRHLPLLGLRLLRLQQRPRKRRKHLPDWALR